MEEYLRRMREAIKKMASEMTFRYLDFERYVAPSKPKPEPVWMPKLNANQRRKKQRYLLNKWERQIAVIQVKARLQGRIPADEFEIAKRLEQKAHFERNGHQAIQAPGKVAEAWIRNGRRI